MARTEFNTAPYVRSHGAEPRGRGSWAFATEPDAEGDEVRFSPSLTYSEAKRWARGEFEKGAEVFVLP